jgi:outer membrane protein OmpA-like peptidoglycan-associated protein
VSSSILSDQKSTFKMSLPTSFNVQIDYLVLKDFYVNYSTAISVKLAKDPNKVHQKAIHTLTPRIEKDKFSLMLPLSIQNNSQFNVGIAGRYLMGNVNLFMGTNNLTFLFGKRTIYTANFFIGANYNIFYTVPSDIDGDKISDPFDDCVYDPGLAALKGCPDTDGDGIPDKDDYCIYDAGPKNTFGCPDSDGDGVIDLNDQCPETAGLAIHYGCPDSDHDGVIDVADQCPEVPGVELNNGCPFEITNCCLDDDGDAVPNSSDKCPTIPGSVYNSGCPIDKDNINTINLNKVKDTMDANHTNEHVDLIESPLRGTNMITGIKKVNHDMENSNYMTSTNVYFKSDDATIKDEDQSKINNVIDSNKDSKVTYVIIGHTDNRGTDNYNLILSRKRAEVVKRSLINRGVNSDQIVIYYYGEWKPAKSNKNTAERKFNRRVEIRVY